MWLDSPDMRESWLGFEVSERLWYASCRRRGYFCSRRALWCKEGFPQKEDVPFYMVIMSLSTSAGKVDGGLLLGDGYTSFCVTCQILKID